MARNPAQRTAPISQPTAAPQYATRRRLAEIYEPLYGPISHRTLETWPLTWRIMNGRAVASVDEFLAEAARRFNAAPAIRGGRSKSPGNPDRLAA